MGFGFGDESRHLPDRAGEPLLVDRFRHAPGYVSADLEGIAAALQLPGSDPDGAHEASIAPASAARPETLA